MNLGISLKLTLVLFVAGFVSFFWWLKDIQNGAFVVELMNFILQKKNLFSIRDFPFNYLYKSKLEENYYRIGEIVSIDEKNQILGIKFEQDYIEIPIDKKQISSQEIIIYRHKQDKSTSFEGVSLKENWSLVGVLCPGDLVQVKYDRYKNVPIQYPSRENPLSLYILQESNRCVRIWL